MKSNQKKVNKKRTKNNPHRFLNIFPRGKEGMMEDLGDLIFTVIAAFFILFFLNGVLGSNADNNEAATNYLLREVQFKGHALDFLRTTTEIDGVKYSMLELVTLMNVAEGKKERAEAFENIAKFYFNQLYPHELEGQETFRPWSLTFYDDQERENQNSDFIGYVAGYQSCFVGEEDHLSIPVTVKTLEGKEITVNFCVFKSHLK